MIVMSEVVIQFASGIGLGLLIGSMLYFLKMGVRK